MEKKYKALVVLSGGQDSTTCLGIAMAKHETVEAITFLYGQRHAIELQCAQALTAKHKINHKIVELPFMEGLVRSALLTTGADADKVNPVSSEHPDKPGLPASFVPNRNAIFLTLAHAWAQTIGAQYIYTGVCETDFSGYPDCRDVFVRGLNTVLDVGAQTSTVIATPLMHINKAQTFALAAQYGFLSDVLELSHTCYNGDHATKHAWGYGCGTCPACLLRAAGWDRFRREHPLLAAPNAPREFDQYGGAQ